MKKRNRYLICSIFILLGILYAEIPAKAQGDGAGDSIRVEELLILDTLGLEIYGPSNDVAFYLNGVVFLSNSKYHQEMIPDHITFGQVTSYFAPLEYISLESSRPLFPNDPFPYSPAGSSYTRDYQSVYFTKRVDITGKRSPEKIFRMDILAGKATTYDQLPFTAGPTRYLHPAISADGNVLVFASDLVPTEGGLDLFVVTKTRGGWTMPVNLGSDINTSGHEQYPFLDQHNNLYFSSSGHMGYGGLDIYVCLFDGEGWGTPQNLTDLVNGPKDEIGFSIHPNRRMAVFSTDSEEPEVKKEILKLELNKSAFILAGIESDNQDLSLLLEDMIRTGYTSAEFGSASPEEVEAGFNLTALPLITEGEEEITEEPPAAGQAEPEPEPREEEPVPELPAEPEPEPEPVLGTTQPEEEAATAPVSVEPVPVPVPVEQPDPDRVVFRIQILSSSQANTRPAVTIAGTTYETWEYYYKGAYRITVGEFEDLQDAIEFRQLCRDSGFNQAFPAAFRGDERETDPSVFRR